MFFLRFKIGFTFYINGHLFELTMIVCTHADNGKRDDLSERQKPRNVRKWRQKGQVNRRHSVSGWLFGRHFRSFATISVEAITRVHFAVHVRTVSIEIRRISLWSVDPLSFGWFMLCSWLPAICFAFLNPFDLEFENLFCSVIVLRSLESEWN